MSGAAALLLVLVSGWMGQVLAQEGLCGTKRVLGQEETHLNSAPAAHEEGRIPLSQSQALGQMVQGHGGCVAALVPIMDQGSDPPSSGAAVPWLWFLSQVGLLLLLAAQGC